MQTLKTTDWTEVTGLTQNVIYVVQATKKGHLGSSPIQCYWTQNEPTDMYEGLLADTIKLKYNGKLYVRSQATPVYVNFEEVN
jgi:hypothetical protein